jgi:hypothetical protein
MYTLSVHRTDLLDTSATAWRILLQRVRQLTPEQRLRLTFEHMEAMREFRKRTEHLRQGSRAL